MKKDFTYFGFVLFGSFVLFMLGLVFFATIQRVELTSDRYYEEELDFQNWKIKTDRANKANKNVMIIKTLEQLALQFSASGIVETNTINGKIFFYKPNSKAHDFNLTFETTTGLVKLDPSRFVSGNYLVKVEWTTADIFSNEGYATETTFNFNGF